MEEKRKLKFIFFSFTLLLVVGIVGYMILLKVSFIDALYMTVITPSVLERWARRRLNQNSFLLL